MFRCSGDDSFGPVLGPSFLNPGCYNFDFTLVFEDSIFSIGPSCIALLLCAWRIYGLTARKVVVHWPLLRALKLVAFAAQSLLQLSLVALRGSVYGVRTLTTLPTGVLDLLSTLALLVLSDFEHCRTTRPSAIIQSFFLFTILLDVPRLRTAWLLDDNYVAACLFTASFSLRVLLLVLESFQKWKRATVPPDSIAPEERQGIFGRISFWWLMPMFFEGYRRDLSMDDLFAIDDDLKGPILYERLLQSWNSVDQKGKHCLTVAVLRTFFPELSLALIPRLAFAGFTLAQPYLINAMITYITFHKQLPENYGYGLIGAYALCYTGLALCSRMWMQVAFRTMTKIRGSLVTIIYKKMLAVRAESTNSSSAVSLMSTDVDRITMTTFMCVNLAPDVVQLVIALCILGIQLGATSVAPVILCVICIGIAARIAKLVPPRQRRWMAAIQKRVGITSDIIGAMKGVKVAGLSEKVDKQIQGLRNYELDRSIQFRKMQIATQLLGTSPTLLMPAVTFAAYAIAQKAAGGDQFGVAKAFTSLSLLNVLMGPVMDLTNAWTNLSSALACLDRIQVFLLKENREDYRLLTSQSSENASLTTRNSDLKLDDIAEPQEKVEKPVIKIRGGSFGWKEDPASAIIKDINLDIMPGELTLIVGPVASGKSTLLQAILGEARMLSGSLEFTIPEEVAFCGQDAWLLNQSVKENILAFREYSKDAYEAVMEACQLEEDIQQFPKRDDSIIGSRGISLSGGQKQRVALARALYNCKPVVILDDVLKGLDADTYTKCFTAILGPGGLLRRNRTAVILATHNVQLLPHAEHIIVLDEEGRIAEKGSFDDLNSSNGYVNSLGIKAAALKEIEAVVAREQEDEMNEKEAMIEKIELSASEPKSDEKKKSRGKRNSDALFSYIRSMGNIYFPVFCAFTLCNIGFRSAQPLWLNVWTAANEGSPNSNLGYYIGIYMLFGGLNVVFLGLQFWTFMIVIVPHSAKVLHRKVLTAVMHAPLPFFVVTDTGEIVNRFSQDMTLVDLQLPMSFMQSYSREKPYSTEGRVYCSTLIRNNQNINAVAQIALTCVGSGWLGIAIPVMLLLLFVLQKFYLRTSRQMRLLDLEAKSPLYSHFISSFAGLTALRAYGWSQLAAEQNLHRLNESQRPYYLLRCVQRWLTLVLNLIVAGLAVLLVGISIALKDQISPGLLGVALTSIMGIGQTLSQLIQSWTQLETSLGAVTRINQFAADTPREPDGPDMPPPVWPNKGAISISGLYAKYGDHTVLTDINLDIQPGQKIAVCGRSGSGKSTLISLLLRLYEPASGRIVIDGIDTETLNLNALRESIVALPQDPMFLAGTVRYNLDPLSAATDEEVWAALDKTGIKEGIKEKGGLDADLNTDWLSAGQRQLFCLARAMLRNSKVILLDEATSSLDRETEACVDELVRTEFKDWTAIVVAHRLKTIADFDKVLVLQDGRVIEYDSPGNLLARESKFKMMWDLQES